MSNPPSSPQRSLLPVLVRAGQVASFGLGIVFGSMSLYNLLTSPSIAAAAWGTLCGVAMSVWDKLITYGMALRATTKPERE
ncbi:hypothetical protein ABZY57_04155 [Streptomyces sp. NPDC006450]|uniref:hypothetical protein n=1 Tax=Streptomyces sp. NPDC006450 TaxID=3155458 RepID=UPI00339F15ED